MNIVMCRRVFLIAAAAVGCICIPFMAAQAQEGLSVTVTPPLFQLTIGPGESWSSAVKVVNSNSYDVTYYANVMNFEAQGEAGQGKFIPVIEEFTDVAKRTSTLASWIDLPQTSVTVKGGESGEFAFSVRIPDGAEPGGHYAAIMVGTQPPSGPASPGANMKVSSYVTSLLFVRIKGDIIEQGRIREFRAKSVLYQSADADFLVRFENLGNTHVRPQGSVTIYNMWGKERGNLPINTKSNFGNVLPQSIRKFEFSWSGESNPFDIGRYSAVITLAYGEDNKRNVSATAYFWVVPVVPVAVSIGSVLAFLTLLFWFIRRYIRRALELEKLRYGIGATGNFGEYPQRVASTPALATILQPIRESVVDLRSISGQKAERSSAAASILVSPDLPVSRGLTIGQYVQKYRLLFVFLLVVAISLIGVRWYLKKALVPQRPYTITEQVSVNE